MASSGTHRKTGNIPIHVLNNKRFKEPEINAELAAATPKPKEMKEFVPFALSKKRQPFVDIRAP